MPRLDIMVEAPLAIDPENLTEHDTLDLELELHALQIELKERKRDTPTRKRISCTRNAKEEHEPKEDRRKKTKKKEGVLAHEGPNIEVIK
ncbi:hypothetical protein CVT25_013346 [Psilocybe cyanescens]|uniref:Uncharacterized protein n=1 Tax=Psilocybe cyanescens TaxID=93625 RepID=A0A409WT33_PSICY|nr:hypothetical protein CVT25_013346 [Psilocybe cyanescens]